MLQPVTAARKYTVDDLLALGEDTRCELIHGEIVSKDASGVAHVRAEVSLATWAHRRFGGRVSGRWPGGWYILPEVHVVYEPHQVFCHDIAGYRRERLDPPPEGWIEGIRPDWVCEVLSRGHAKRDLVDKFAVLHAAGVPDYWVIDRDARILFMYQHASTGYVMRTVGDNAAIRARPFDGVELRTAVIFGDEDDED